MSKAQRAGLFVFVVALALSIQTAFPSATGPDYEIEMSDTIDSLVRGDLHAAMVTYPVVGPLALLLRVPFVALVFHADVRVVYLFGSVPLLAGLAFVAIWLRRVAITRAGALAAGMVAVLFVLNPVTFRALHWGHPEEPFAAALLVAAVAAGISRRSLAMGVLFGLAVSTKQWTVLALPVMLFLPGIAWFRCLGAAAAIFAVLSAPFYFTDPARYVHANVAAGNPSTYYRHRVRLAPGETGRPPQLTPVTPANVWWPFVDKRPEVQGRHVYRVGYMTNEAAAATHAAAALLALLIAFAARPLIRRRPVDALLALALVFLLRSLLDPLDFDYHHAAFLLCLLGWDALSGREVPWLSLGAVVALGVTFASHPFTLDQTTSHAWWISPVYLAWTLPLTAYLAARLIRPEFVEGVRRRALPPGRAARTAAARPRRSRSSSSQSSG